MSRIFAILFLTISIAQARTWVNTEGKRFEGILVESSNGQATIRLKNNNKQVTVPHSKLSQYDLNYIRTWQASYRQWQYNNLLKKVTGFDQAWPSLVTIPVKQDITIVSEDPIAKKFVYQSEHYEYICDARLSRSVVGKFSLLFEATHNYCSKLPLKMIKPHLANNKKLRILLTETLAGYHRLGGPPGSAGVYMPRNDTIIVPLTSLGVRKVGSGYMVDHDKTNKTLAHELTHQLTDRPYYSHGALGWFSEGLAEYVAVTSYRSGKYNLKNQTSHVKAYATARGKRDTGGRGIGENITMPPLKTFMTLSYRDFTANGNKNYALGLMILHHFIHWDGDKDRACLNAFLDALRKRQSTEKAFTALLGGRTFQQLEEDITKAWRSRGVKISFTR